MLRSQYKELFAFKSQKHFVNCGSSSRLPEKDQNVLAVLRLTFARTLSLPAFVASFPAQSVTKKLDFQVNIRVGVSLN